MAKYMVMVNRKFMISVEAESACGAEHVILDQFADSINRHGSITSAQAFGKDDMKTSTFLECMMNCETISLNELDRKIQMFEDCFDALSEQGDAIEEAEKMIIYYEAKIEDMQRILEAKRSTKEKTLKQISERRDELNAR